MLDGQTARLTQAALETLAIVAYRQPVSRARVGAVRGVNVDAVMRTLLNRGLVEEAGHDPETGAVLYRTTTYFLHRIGLTSIEELPALAPVPARDGRARRDRRRGDDVSRDPRDRPARPARPARRGRSAEPASPAARRPRPGRRAAAEGARSGRARLAAGLRAADRGGSGAGRRPAGARARGAGRPASRGGARGRAARAARRHPADARAEQAGRGALRDERSAGTADGGRPGGRPARSGCSTSVGSTSTPRD